MGSFEKSDLSSGFTPPGIAPFGNAPLIILFCAVILFPPFFIKNAKVSNVSAVTPWFVNLLLPSSIPIKRFVAISASISKSLSFKRDATISETLEAGLARDNTLVSCGVIKSFVPMCINLIFAMSFSDIEGK